jgi:translation initiation factor IF-3
LSTPDKGDPRRPDARRELPLLNERIRDREVRLIGDDGAQLGIVPTREALGIAKEKGLDLFVVQPDATPPVAKIMDYGRFKFEQEKKSRETKRKHHIVDVKEIKMRYKIEEHDYQVKLKHAQKFLTDGDKIKVLTILRGREMQHKDMAMQLMTKFAVELKELGMMDREPKMEGKSVIMILSPIPQRGGGKPSGPASEDEGA